MIELVSMPARLGPREGAVPQSKPSLVNIQEFPLGGFAPPSETGQRGYENIHDPTNLDPRWVPQMEWDATVAREDFVSTDDPTDSRP